jgi:3-oxoadipate enol-lactonase
MPHIKKNDISINYLEEGDPSGFPIIFSNSLGTNLHLWDDIIPYLNPKFRLVRYDKRGHGNSTSTKPPYTMNCLVSDIEFLIDSLNIEKCVFVGLSIGGMIAQGLAARRPSLIKALVLSNTASKIGTKELWEARVKAVEVNGLPSMVNPVMERWFSKSFFKGHKIDRWRNMFLDTHPNGYIGCCTAISHTDFYEQASTLRMPTLVLAGSEDGSTPPNLVKETQNLIKESEFYIIKGAGHLPCVEKPKEFAKKLNNFINSNI